MEYHAKLRAQKKTTGTTTASASTSSSSPVGKGPASGGGPSQGQGSAMSTTTSGASAAGTTAPVAAERSTPRGPTTAPPPLAPIAEVPRGDDANTAEVGARRFELYS